MNLENLKVIPLGGCYEIGKNSTLFEYKEEIIVVDCGVTFPSGRLRAYGIDLIVPDFSYLLKKAAFLKAILLTHGHEDHIGAVAYLLEYINVPVYGTPFTLELLKNRLAEFKIKKAVSLNYVEYGEKILVSKYFNIEFIRTTHSIVDSSAILMETPLGKILHTGDFKIDYTPIDGNQFDFYRFAEIGKEGLHLLLSDSTNALVSGFSNSEKYIIEGLRKVFSEAKEVIFAATFASHIHRLQTFFNLARELNRHIVLSGRSIETNVELAIKMKYLNPEGIKLVSIKKIKNYPRNKLLIITTGTQGEPMSILSLLSQKKHPILKIQKNDTVVISARVIPGNEKEVIQIVNKFLEYGAHVSYENFDKIHVSGHAYIEELKLMISLTKPKFFLPLHGAYQNLSAHAEIAKELGVAEENTHVIRDGNVVSITKNNLKVIGNLSLKEVFVSNEYNVNNFDKLVSDRKILSAFGFILINMFIPQIKSEGALGLEQIKLEIISKGFLTDKDLIIFKGKLQKNIVKYIKENEKDIENQKDFLYTFKKNIKIKVRKLLNKNMRRKKPIIIINIY